MDTDYVACFPMFQERLSPTQSLLVFVPKESESLPFPLERSIILTGPLSPSLKVELLTGEL